MILSTTSTIDGKQVKQYVGIVTGEAIIGANFISDIFASVTNFIGERSGAYEGALRKAREAATEEITQEAQKLGANAVIGVNIDYEYLDKMLMVSITGTAVIVE